MKAHAEYSAFVEHPRYGKGPRVTGLDVANTPDGLVYCHWHSPPGVRVPNTAVAADVARQGPATVHVTHYFDAKRVCRNCGRAFLFFAEEQKYWYEDLRFPLEADCLECVPCRKDEQHLRAVRRTYDSLLGNPHRTPSEILELVEAGLLLVEANIFSPKLLPRLRGFLKPLLVDTETAHHKSAMVLMSKLDRVHSP